MATGMAGRSRNEASSSRGRGKGGSGGGGDRGESVVSDCGRRRSSCGYCKSKSNTSIAHGLWAYSLTVDDYQDLLDRGWRRSGCFLYKPEMERTCCPSYTIRLKAADFVPSKEQNRVYRRLERFLDGTLEVKKQAELSPLPSTSNVSSSSAHEASSSRDAKPLSNNKDDNDNVGEFVQYLSDEIDKVVKRCTQSGEFPSNIEFPTPSVREVSQAKKRKLVKGSEEDLLYTCNIAFQLAAALSRTQSNKMDGGEDIKLSGDSNEDKGQPFKLSPKAVAEKLVDLLSHLQQTSGLSIRACNGHINFYSARRLDSAGGVAKTIPCSKDSQTMNGNTRTAMKCSYSSPRKKRKLEIHLERSSFDPEEYDLYRRYQIKVHNDPPGKVSESSYKRFLVDTPLVFVPSTGDSTVPPCGFGSFHQRYIIDGRLVAVGVIDILPKCLSSKYLFWDPDLAFLSLGKYSALQEINWVRENQIHCPSLEYYYLGYYIHSCSKMRYKAAYYPSELLCPLRYKWVPFGVAKPLLDRRKYVVLSDYIGENGEPLLPSNSDHPMELQPEESEHNDSNDLMIEDGGMVGSEDEVSSDDDLELETGELGSAELEDGDIGNIIIGSRGSRTIKYKAVIHSRERGYLEAQLRTYMRVVGRQLSERMIYSLGPTRRKMGSKVQMLWRKIKLQFFACCR
ncbi:arginyl-tRNA--protein transferase 2 isoform X2 [Punica granatum]|uniref:arginyltransferase n=1 Tax=Punica granatum TaxID=22663 RepID=A0A6P8BUC6_PUNGR|nr:arginyl-tRNA--protein transferase 2 isoform X2 [Punica granatum]